MRNSPSSETNRELFEYEAFTPNDPPLIRRQTCAYLRVICKRRTAQRYWEAKKRSVADSLEQPDYEQKYRNDNYFLRILHNFS